MMSPTRHRPLPVITPLISMMRPASPAAVGIGGKLTTYRKLAEHALEKLTPHHQGIGPAWTNKACRRGRHRRRP
ncbi:hypothetical protein ACNKHM_14595 [Shigella sonnei]